ncbi:MAG: hypothetical protein A3H17_04500 [Candidatus Levybacteria bacterium RIFCSPLOWO2_12_FULL_37_14]|nr:MAG: Glycosyl transferase group 1 [Candidatus Levybacteria bacterium GW2011_GWA1_37_16]KKQ38523.1 MAG: Glycosyl transferase group 1 [Candidatus Levybacteria bacterium GW2011_GWC2_37_7]KKQ41676.1 MAG: Glycosyl transferase group 1 [Candidatus Levybacteria bacterium GW2011_GWB1_37_8]OGH50095.1 MAG: hypothetical protein A3H17_04500 [Candidatus Levybacteria bacterium RIFCSPLOWO2_12_FULL_37_14]
MNIAIDISPLKNGHYLQHRVRGTGFYLQNLKSSLEKYYPENKYVYFNRGDSLDEDIDVVHYPYFEPFFLTLPVFSKNKKIVTVHDLTPLVFPEHFRAGLKGSLKWQLQKLALKNANAIVTDSESSKRDVIKYIGINSEKIKVVYLAAGEEFKRINDKGLMIKEIRKKYGLPEKFILYVGDATWNKNLPRLIEVASKISVPLVMVGKALIDRNIDTKNPWNKDLVKVQEEASQNKNVLRLGFVSSEDLVALYNLATLFIMPSIYEGFGLPVLEAMGCGCPVVTSRGGSLAEVVGEAGRYIDPYDVDSIAKGISEVFNDPSLQKELSQKGIIQSRKFTWRKTADETMGVYESVVAK